MKQSILIIPEEFMQKLSQQQDKIIELLSTHSTNPTADCITEKEAREIFKRKTTWFWQMRKSGILPFSKIGKSVYYSINDLKTLMENSKISKK